MQAFQQAYRDESNLLNWFAFLGHLREPMGPLRREMVELIFDKMDDKQEGKITIEELCNCLVK